MFTGIVQDKIKIAWISHSPKFTRYALDFPDRLLTHLNIGASVSVNGICQTVVAIENRKVVFEAIQETLECTTLPLWQEGELVNVERSLKMGDEIGGHLLSGHIIGVATIHEIIEPGPEQSIVTVLCPDRWMKYLLPKGYVAINGASLTIGEVHDNHFTVNLIPETRRITTFGSIKVGQSVNIEIDSQTQAIVDTVERFLSTQSKDKK